MISVNEAVKLTAIGPRNRPLILADTSDNPGGGAASDSSFILQALLDAGVENIAEGLIYDPEAVAACHEAGKGARLRLSIGGKLSRFSGAPVDLDVEVMGIASGAVMHALGTRRDAMGETAWVRGPGEVDIVLSSARAQAFTPEIFTHLGLDPASKDVLVLKSSNHFRASFSDLAGEIAVVSTPGTLNFDFAHLPYKQMRRAYYPKVAQPFSEAKEGVR